MQNVILLLLLINLVHYSSQQQQAAAADILGESPSQDEPSASLDSEATTASGSSKVVDYVSPVLDRYHFFEHFDDSLKFDARWIKSSDDKYKGQWKLDSSQELQTQADLQLILASKANHHAISTKLDKPFVFSKQKQLQKPLVVQYEVQFREGLDCGGAYLKLLRTPSKDLSQLNDKTPYSIMFGPDKCGGDNKLHFIVNYKNPVSKKYEEKHWKLNKHSSMVQVFSDKRPHFFRLVLQPNDQFELYVDDKQIATGSLLEDMEPAINPPKEIVDESDTRPLDWDDRAKIEDPNAKKPDDWDEEAPRKISDPAAQKPADWLEHEPKMIADPEAVKPKDWDTEMDGEWEAPVIDNPACKTAKGCGPWTAPLIDNPNYKGKWRAPMIDNPAYKGVWSPRMIPNPDYFHDENPFKSLDTIDAVSFELWSMSEMIAFDNILITDDLDTGKFLQRTTWQLKKIEADASSPSIVTKFLSYTQQYPWLWAVCVLAVGLPLCLFIAFCCTGKKTSTGSSERIAANKKEDISSPDTVPVEEAKEADDEDGDDGEKETRQAYMDSESDDEFNKEQQQTDDEEDDAGDDDEEEEEEKEGASEEDGKKAAGDDVNSKESSKRQTRRSKRN